MRQQQGKCTSLPETKLHFFTACHISFCFARLGNSNHRKPRTLQLTTQTNAPTLSEEKKPLDYMPTHHEHLAACDTTICYRYLANLTAPVRSRLWFSCNTISTMKLVKRVPQWETAKRLPYVRYLVLLADLGQTPLNVGTDLPTKMRIIWPSLPAFCACEERMPTGTILTMGHRLTSPDLILHL